MGVGRRDLWAEPLSVGLIGLWKLKVLYTPEEERIAFRVQ